MTIARRRWSVVLLSLAGSVASSVSCSLLVDTEGLAGSSTIADAAPDTSSVTLDSSSADAKPEAASADAGCALYPDAAFCNDFEGPDPLSTNVWTETDVGTSAGTIALTTDTSESPTHAASLSVPASSPGCTYLQLSRLFPGPSSRIAVDLRVLVHQKGGFLSLSGGSTIASTSYEAS